MFRSPFSRRGDCTVFLLVMSVVYTSFWMLAAAPGWEVDEAVPLGDESPPWAPTTVPPQPGPGTTTKMRFDAGEERQLSAQYHNKRGVPDSAEQDVWKHRKQNSWKLIILFQHNFGILQQAVAGFRRGSDIMVPNMIIVDNSIEREAYNSAELRAMVHEVVVTPKALNFPQLHNFMATLALERRLEWYFWAHADNYVLPMEPGRDLGKDVIDCMRETVARFPKWGMVLCSYDHLAAYRTQALVQVPWDPHVFQYGSECDAYGRIRDAGYAAKACKVHLSYDMKRVIGITDEHTYEETKAMLEEEKKDKKGRNAWRENSMSAKEQAWRTAMKAASKEYLASKWGEVKCKLRGVPCSKPWP